MKVLFLSVVVTALLFVFGSGVRAQGVGVGKGVGVSIDVETIPLQTRSRPFRRVYAAKFLCGTIEPDSGGQFPAGEHLFVPGTYLTDLEILNTFPRRIGLQLEAGVTNPGLVSDPLGDPLVLSIEGNEALQLDCSTIIDELIPGAFDLKTEFIKGWIVTRSAFSLHVMAVYQLKNVEEKIERGEAD